MTMTMIQSSDVAYAHSKLGKIPLSVSLWSAFELCTLTASVLVSVITEDWSWFQRCGSVMALIGALEIPKGFAYASFGTLSMVAGTLIWGYGDLIGRLL